MIKIKCMKRVIFICFLVCLGVFSYFTFGDKGFLAFSNFDQIYFQLKTVSNQYDLTTMAGREMASVNKGDFTYKTSKCGIIKHTDGDKMVFCLGEFNDSTGGFYSSDKELMVVGSFNQYVLIHEITHATTLHFYKKGFTNILSSEVQEKMAYNAEHLLMQIIAFKEDMNITPDISDEEKIKVGIPLNKKLIAPTKTVALNSKKVFLDKKIVKK